MAHCTSIHVPLHPTGRVVMCLGGSEEWILVVNEQSAPQGFCQDAIGLCMLLLFVFNHHKSLMLVTRVLLHKPLFHNALLALTFTVQKYCPA